MKSFKEYAQNTPTEEKENKETATAEELTKKIASAYNGRSNADMLRSILAEAEKSKRQGTLTNEEIDEFFKQFAPLLGSSERKRLQAVVDKLKRI